MTALSVLQQRALRVSELYRAQFGIADDPAYYIGKLAEEMGEVTAAHLKVEGLSRGSDADPATLSAALEDELADLLGFLLVYSEKRGVDLTAAFDRKWGRYLEDTDDPRGD